MEIDEAFGLGRIREILSALSARYKTDDVTNLAEGIKLDCLSSVLGLTATQFDELIANNSPVWRTVKGHVFEVIFDELVTKSGLEIEEVGGDQGVDRVLNGKTLQLKTPTKAGTRGTQVQFKTHKTHGAKSEMESLDYYHRKAEFAEYLVGRVSYNPLRILILHRDELPTHQNSPDHIQSPFSVVWDGHPALNAYSRIGIEELDESGIVKVNPKEELLPSSTGRLQVSTNVILNTILKESNFRIWDMAIRGFSREIAFKRFLTEKGILYFPPAQGRQDRADKSDVALLTSDDKNYRFLQVKGVTLGSCKFIGQDSILATETQLTRGRANDHPTQSRLYMKTDFDYLLLCVDPCVANKFLTEIGEASDFSWQFYCVPVEDLGVHHKYGRRLKSMQTTRYVDLQPYRIRENWSEGWLKDEGNELVLLP